jgi:hypothetical protein
MLFIHPLMLLAGLAVAVPIVIHLLNRRSAKTIDWGAMEFLLGSLVSRKRRVLLEEILLLGCRCLLVALAVTALARPVIPAGSSLAWAVVLPMVLAGCVSFGVGTAAWQQPRWRWGAYGLGVGLLSLAVLAVTLDRVLHLAALVGDARDVALVIDGSSSMKIEVQGKTNFARAVEEAREVIRNLNRSSTASIVLAGPVPQVKTPFPLTDSEQLLGILNGLEPSGGPMDVHAALQTASLGLALGTNPTKQIVLITDGQRTGWTPSDRSRWQATAQEVRGPHALAPQLFCRTLDLPARPRNIALTELSCSRRIVGTDRPLGLRVQVVNTGQSPVPACAAYFSVDGKQVDRRPITQLDSGASETLSFSYRFPTPGPHVVEVRADIDDDLADDNRLVHVVYVLDRLPVLLIDGRPGGRLLDRAGGFLQLALDPPNAVSSGDGKRGQSPQAKGDSPFLPPAAADGKRGQSPQANGDSPLFPQPPGLVEVRMVEPWRVREVQDWDHYRVVVLADVVDLPAEVTSKIVDFVLRGGGLLIAPGQQASPAFYNGWNVAQGEERMRFLPATLKARVAAEGGGREGRGGEGKGGQPPLPSANGESPALAGVQLSMSSLVHPALVPLLETKKTDLDTVEINNYWQLETNPAGREKGDSPHLGEAPVGPFRQMGTVPVFLGGRLTNGESWLLEKSFGRGKVLLTATALDVRDSNLPTRQSFVPLVHALVYYLAGDAQWDLNQHPAKQLVLRFPAAPSGVAAGANTAAPGANTAAPVSPGGHAGGTEKIKGELTGPDRSRREAIGRVEQGTLSVQIDRVVQPGLYHLKMPGLAVAKPLPAWPPGLTSDHAGIPSSDHAGIPSSDHTGIPLAPAATPALGPAAKPPDESADLGIPLAVQSDPDESNLDRLTEKDFQSLASWVKLEHLAHREDLQAIAAGRAHGVELWKSLVMLAFLIAVLEVVLTRWIALRRIPTAGPADFSQRATTSDFQEELDKFRAQEESRKAEEAVDLSQYMQ